METRNKIFYITTPIYYVNSAPHVGHYYTTLACDIMARFKKLDGYDVKFLTGTDEHGQKIEQSANKAGKTPQEFVDEVSQSFVDLVKLMKFEPSVFDYLGKYKDNDFSFIRTTNPKHEKVVQNVWRKLVENGWIYKGKYSGYYCVSDEAYYTKDELIEDENGQLHTDLGKYVSWKEEDSYFFKLGDFQEILLALFKYYPDFIAPEIRRNEIVSFVSGLSIREFNAGIAPKKAHLQDLSISRNNFDWGIKIPTDLEGNELLDEKGEWKDNVKPEDRHVIYVWLDALFNYLSALGGYEGVDYKKYWKNSKNKFHLMGKEIIRFHAVYWPAFLIAYEYSSDEFKKKSAEPTFIKEILETNLLPTRVFAHGFWECEGRKMSKSFGNIIVPSAEIDWLQKEFGISQEVAIDYFRYFLITEIPFGNDGNYSRQRFVDRINSELVNNIGNLTQRTLNMIYKDCNGEVAESESLSKDLFDRIQNATKNFEYDSYAKEIVAFASEANEYIEEQKPWELKKTDVEKQRAVLGLLVERIRKIAILLQPFCPFLAKKMLQQLKIGEQYNIDLEKETVSFSYLQDEKFRIKAGVKIEEPKGIFPRLKKL